MTGVWQVRIGKTLSVQPGDQDFVVVDVDLDSKEVKVQRVNYK